MQQSKNQVSREKIKQDITRAMQTTGNYVDLCRKLDSILDHLENGYYISSTSES